MYDGALVLELPVIIKAKSHDGKRIVEVEASSEDVDSEGDVILQSALLASADSFIRTGHLDIDHISEIGAQIGVQNPTAWIVGVPTEVKDLGNGRTAVVGELHKPIDGRVTKADELWESLQLDPPIRWRASIYGWPTPGGVIDARMQKCKEAPDAQRYVVKGIDWRSLAFTRNPVNDSLEGAARIITAKAFIMKSRQAALAAGGKLPSLGKDYNNVPNVVEPWPYMLPPRNRMELEAHYLLHMAKGECPFAGEKGMRSVASFRDHFSMCCCQPEWEADLQALALAQLIRQH